MTTLVATVEPASEPVGEAAVALRITNDSDCPVEVLNPDLGQPAAGADFPFSVQAYRAAALMSFGFLQVSVHDASGAQIEQSPVPVWSTPLVRPPVRLAPAESLEVVIPVAPFFVLAPGAYYLVAVEYGDQTKVRAEGSVRT